MTGTAYTSRREFKKVYQKKVVRVPTHRPIDRKQLPTQIYHSASQKFEAIAEQIAQLIQQGRPVLVGNRSVGASEMLSAALLERGIKHNVLNAKFLEQEADIVESAGQPSRVTVATNMAGRGTDIKLHPQVKNNGGLHVILTELHESQRIDWQLIGRGSRQGDPGTYQIFLSLEDEILRLGLGPAKAAKLKKRFADRRSVSVRETLRFFQQAQRKTERRYLTDRRIVQQQDLDRQKNHFETGSQI